MPPYEIIANTISSTGTSVTIAMPTNGWSSGTGAIAVAPPTIYYRPHSGISSASNSLPLNNTRPAPQPQPTPEEIAQRRERRLQRERALILERSAAEARARELLLTYLDEAQKAQYEANQHFEVEVRGKRYLITRKRSENVYRIENGRYCERYCVHPGDHEVPLEDQMLAQKLMLEAEEEEFLRVANRFRMAA